MLCLPHPHARLQSLPGSVVPVCPLVDVLELVFLFNQPPEEECQFLAEGIRSLCHPLFLWSVPMSTVGAPLCYRGNIKFSFVGGEGEGLGRVAFPAGRFFLRGWVTLSLELALWGFVSPGQLVAHFDCLNGYRLCLV